MKINKLILFGAGVVLFLGLGIYLGLQYEGANEGPEEAKILGQDNKPADTTQKPGPSNPPIESQSAATVKRDKLSYKDELFSDPIVKSLKKRSLEIFGKYSFGGEISDYIAIGVVMDSSDNYGNIYLGTLKKLNQSPEDVLEALEKEIKGLEEKDSFIRNMVLNLANNLKVSDKEKRNFFGTEITRKVKLDDKGNFTEDSMNITNSMVLFKQYSKSDKDALEFARKTMELNRDNPKIQKELLIRFKSYFPNLTKDLERP